MRTEGPAKVKRDQHPRNTSDTLPLYPALYAYCIPRVFAFAPADAGVAIWGKDFEPTEHAQIIEHANEQVGYCH